jgi:predicted nucleotidyltransferase
LSKTTKSRDLVAYYVKKYPLTFTDTFSPSADMSDRYQKAWKIAKEAAAILKEKFGAKKVVDFGSLTRRTWFNRWSDVDLAVWGIPDHHFYAAVGSVTGLSTEFKVDLVDAESCAGSLRRAVECEGVEI